MSAIDSTALIQALQTPALYPHPVEKIELIETHISWVILTGPFAYKIKKPLDLGFLNFSTLEHRRRYCEQELLLNQRLAPQLYLEVVNISGSLDAPKINSTPKTSEKIIEYAVKMVQFPQQAQFDHLLAAGKLHPQQIDQLARRIANFHQQCPRVEQESHFGTPTAILDPMRENFSQIEPHLNSEEDREKLHQLERWTLIAYENLIPLLQQRHRAGSVRECHGDMHLGNITLFDGEVVIFDCIEFNPELRWIDLISEIAFLVMDLEARGQPGYASRVLNAYLEQSGDYSGLRLLRFYQLYRALVRAKITIMRHAQEHADEQVKKETLQHYRRYIELALHYTQSAPTPLCITCGVSGSGKSTLTQPLLERYSMIRIRSDIERKRLFNLPPERRTESEHSTEIYSHDASLRTYQHLNNLAQQVIKAGFGVIIDATFLERSQRQQFSQLAARLKINFLILHFYADETLLRRWIVERQKQGEDPSEATIEVLERQLKVEEPLTNEEALIIPIDTGEPGAPDKLLTLISPFSPKQFAPLARSS